MNSLNIIGRLGRDPSSKTVAGTTVCAFSVAVDGRKDANGKKDVLWLEVRSWGKLGEICQKYLTKGRQVFVVGELQVKDWTGRDGQKRTSVGITADKVEFLGEAKGASAVAESGVPRAQIPDDSDIPY